jgi:hypothetical protein
VYENRMLRRIFVPKREEVTGEWRKLRNDYLHNCTLHEVLRHQMKEVEWVGHVSSVRK